MLDPHESLQAKGNMGVIPEDLALFDNLTAREYLTFIGRMHLLPRDVIRTRIDELLSLLALEGEEKNRRSVVCTRDRHDPTLRAHISTSAPRRTIAHIFADLNEMLQVRA